jgi:hypothetical protein
MSNSKTYMNEKTGSLGDYNAWYYENEDGQMVNAVDLGEVTEVELDEETNTWVAV